MDVKEVLASNISHLIKDYRNDDGIFIDSDHVLKWVEQFDESDQEFLLNELLHILPSSYLSKTDVLEKFKTVFDYLKAYYKHESVLDFLANVKFLRCQESYKSQTKLLEFLNNISGNEFGIALNDCGQNGTKYWIYLDDVLASGSTFRREIKKEIDAYGFEKFKEDKIQIIPIFFFLHSWGKQTQRWGLFKEYNDYSYFRDLTFHHFSLIENNPKINVHNKDPKFNIAYPSKSLENDKWNSYLENLKPDDPKHKQLAYRELNMPSTETFYSSLENRNRYESIILNKGIELLSNADSLGKSTRPLGFSFPNYQMFGTGSHAFTWRNVSNTCPIVYWWETNNNWTPLFSVANRGGNTPAAFDFSKFFE